MKIEIVNNEVKIVFKGQEMVKYAKKRGVNITLEEGTQLIKDAFYHEHNRDDELIEVLEDIFLRQLNYDTDVDFLGDYERGINIALDDKPHGESRPCTDEENEEMMLRKLEEIIEQNVLGYKGLTKVKPEAVDSYGKVYTQLSVYDERWEGKWKKHPRIPKEFFKLKTKEERLEYVKCELTLRNLKK